MELVADLSWVTKVAESQHARHANIKKFHPEYSLSTILSRTTVCQLNLLMPKPSKDEAVLARLEKQLAKLLTRNPRKSHGKAIFIKELFDLARENASAAKGKRVANLRHIIIKKAGKDGVHYQSLSVIVSKPRPRGGEMISGTSWRTTSTASARRLQSARHA